MNQTINYIKELTAIASPTGFTREISDYLVHTLEELGYQPVRTAKGGVNVTIKGQNDEPMWTHSEPLYVLLNLMDVSNWTGSVVFLGT